MQPYQDVIFSTAGPVRAVSVTVKNYPSGTLATIYSDNGVTVAANPVVTGNDGLFFFYAANGYYTLSISGAGITTQTRGPILLQDFPATIVDVRSAPYLAKCDGVTDDTAAIQACLDANFNRSIYILGTPATSSTITMAGRQRLIFAGGPDAGDSAPPASYLKKKSTMTTVGLVVGFGCFVEGGGVDCQSSQGGGIQLIGNTAGMRDVTVFGSSLNPLSGVGIRVGDDAGTNTNSWLLDNCSVSAMGSHGYDFHSSSANANAGKASHCQSHVNGGAGYRIRNSGVNVFAACLAEGNTGIGMNPTGAASFNAIYGGDFEGNIGGNVVLDAGSTGTISGIDPAAITDNTVAGWVRLDRLTQKQGTWTPTLEGSAVAGTQTYTTRSGTWMRDGDMVDITCLLTLSAFDGTTSGSMAISGLPFAYPAGFTNGVVGCSIVAWGNITLTANYTDFNAEIVAGEQKVRLLLNGSGQATALITSAMMSATSNIQFSARYPIAKF